MAVNLGPGNEGSSFPSTTSPSSSSSSSSSGGGAAVQNSYLGQAGLGTHDVPILRRADADRAVNGPDLPVPPGAIVEVSYIPGQTVTAYVSTTGADAAKAGGPRTAFTATSIPRPINVRNLSELWVYSSVVGEGLQATVRER